MTPILSTLQSTDAQLLEVMRSSIDLSNEWIIRTIHFGADILLIVIPVYLISVWFVGVGIKQSEPKEYAMKVFLSAVLGVIFCLLLNALLPFRPRPETVSAIAPLIDHLPDNSFPSMHATFTWAVIASLFYFYFPFLSAMAGKMRWIFSLEVRGFLCFLWGYMVLSRIFAGIHYPGDILVWIIIWIISASIIRKLSLEKWFYRWLIAFPIKIASFLKL